MIRHCNGTIFFRRKDFAIRGHCEWRFRVSNEGASLRTQNSAGVVATPIPNSLATARQIVLRRAVSLLYGHL